MSKRTGLGLVEVTILSAIAELLAESHAAHVRNDQVIGRVVDELGLAPKYSYQILCDMAAAWAVQVRLVDFHGTRAESPNLGPASPRYTKSRLSTAGVLALQSEAQELGPLPIGLINGDIHADGQRPPFSPRGIFTALRSLLGDPFVSDAEVLALVGPPSFPKGCLVTGEFEALFAGRFADLRLEARFRLDEDAHRIDIDSFPPGVTSDTVAEAISERSNAKPPLPLRPLCRNCGRCDGSRLRAPGGSSVVRDRPQCRPRRGGGAVARSPRPVGPPVDAAAGTDGTSPPRVGKDGRSGGGQREASRLWRRLLGWVMTFDPAI